MTDQNLDLLVQRVTQPIGTFYVGVMSASVLRRNAQSETRQLRDAEEKNTSGIQRALNEDRIKEIRQYLHTSDASFPNSIILSLDPARIVDGPDKILVQGQDLGLVKIIISQDPRAFSIIDGQHRLKGFDEDSEKEFQLIVAIFIGLDEEDKAYLFSTINSKQTKVSKSLVYDLFDVAERRSPQRSAHDIAKLLNSDATSPFYRRIKLLGTNPKFENEVLYKANISQGTFVERLLALISKDPAMDRDVIRRGQNLDRLEREAKLVFRPMWVDEQDGVILKVLFNYFSEVAAYFPDEWKDGAKPLAKTIGFGALMSLLIDLVSDGMKERDLSVAFFHKELGKIRRGYEKIGPPLDFDNFPAAGNGESKLLGKLREWRSTGTV